MTDAINVLTRHDTHPWEWSGTLTAGAGAGSSVAASIAAQMHTASVKLLSAALDILAAGAATGR